MIQLKTIFENWFDDEKITIPRLISFTQDHLVRMGANNPGNVYNINITNTEAALAGVVAALETEELETDQAVGSTTAFTMARKTMQSFISNKEGHIKSSLGKPSQGYSEFFPQGLTGYHKATDGQFTTLVNTFVTKTTNYQAQLGLPFVTEVTNARDAYAATAGLHINEQGEVEPAKTALLVVVHSLQIQLVTNVLTIALQNVGGPAEVVANTYFNEALLFADHRKRLFKGEPVANSTTVVCEFEYAAGKSFRMKNKGAQALDFRFSVDDIPVGTTFTVQPGETVSKNFPDFYATGDSLLCINSQNVAGNYQVEELS